VAVVLEPPEPQVHQDKEAPVEPALGMVPAVVVVVKAATDKQHLLSILAVPVVVVLVILTLAEQVHSTPAVVVVRAPTAKAVRAAMVAVVRVVELSQLPGLQTPVVEEVVTTLVTQVPRAAQELLLFVPLVLRVLELQQVHPQLLRIQHLYPIFLQAPELSVGVN
jgi:hypothetical protein